MDASTYLRRKRESMPQYIHKPTVMDAGQRTAILSQSAGSAHYVSPNAAKDLTTCASHTTHGFAGSATATPVRVPGCCAAPSAGPITLPGCERIYEPSHTPTACKVTPYFGTRASSGLGNNCQC